MKTDGDRRPACYGDVHIVFPMGENGLRQSPESCLACRCKTDCLRSALAHKDGLKVRRECLDRAYASGMMGFFERWSRKKALFRRARHDGRDPIGGKK